MVKTVASLVKSKPQWSKDETPKIMSAVNNILAGGDGGIESYDPNFMSKVGTALSIVDDYAHKTSPVDMGTKYESVPSDLMDGLHHSSYQVDEDGAMSQIELLKEAKNNGFRLDDSELDKLTRYPGSQRGYLNIKKASVSVSSENMELGIDKMVEDYDNNILQNKNQLKTRLKNILESVDNDSLDFTVDNIWDILKQNSSQSVRVKKILSENKELNGFEDRTNRLSEKATGIADGIVEGIMNLFGFTSKLAVKLGTAITPRLGEYGEEVAENYLLNVNLNNLSDKTRVEVENYRAYNIGRDSYDARGLYKKVVQDEALNTLSDIVEDRKDPYAKSTGKQEDYGKKLDLAEASAGYQYSKKIGVLVDEIMATRGASSIFTSLVGDFLGGVGGTEATLKFLDTAQTKWYNKLAQKAIKLANLAVEGTAFEATGEGEVSGDGVLGYMLAGMLVNGATNWGRGTLEKSMLKSVLGKSFEPTVNQIMKTTGYTSKQAIHAMVDLLGRFSVRGTSQEISAIIKETSSDIGEGIVNLLKNTEGEFTLDGVKTMADYLLGKGVKGLGEWTEEGTLALLRNKLSKVAGEDTINEMFNMIKKIGSGKGSNMSLLEAYTIRKVFGRAVNAWTKSGAVTDAQQSIIGNDLYMTALNQIEKYFAGSQKNLFVSDFLKNTKFGGVQDMMNVEDVLGRMEDGVLGKLTEGFFDRFAKAGLKFLGGGTVSSIAKEGGAEGLITNPYIDTGLLSSAIATVTSPKKATQIIRMLSQASLIERYSLVNGLATSSTQKAQQEFLQTWIQSFLTTRGLQNWQSFEDWVNEEYSGNEGGEDIDVDVEDEGTDPMTAFYKMGGK